MILVDAFVAFFTGLEGFNGTHRTDSFLVL